MIPKLPADARGYDLDLAEPYIDEDDGPSVALIWNGVNLHFRSIKDWKETEPELGKYLEGIYFSSDHHRWRYPSRPILPEDLEDIRRLHIDIQRCNDQYIEFPDSAWPSVFATWLMGGYLVPFLPRSPILQLYGPTGSGKGQVLDQVDRLGFHSKKMISPTPAPLYRLADRWRPTFALDELQDQDKDTFRAVMNIIKGSYDGTPVYRCDANTGEVDEFRTRSFFAISLKGKRPLEDIQNRGIIFTMQQNGTHKLLVPEDSAEHIDLRARMTGLRLRCLTDPQFVENALAMVQERGTPEELGFDRRPRDIAISLLLPAILSHQEEELLETIRKSAAEAQDANNSTFSGLVHHTLDELISGIPSSNRYYPVISLRNHLEEELRADGELKDNERLKTRNVTDALKTLGYKIARRANNAPFIDREDKQNINALLTNRKKYALPEDVLEA